MTTRVTIENKSGPGTLVVTLEDQDPVKGALATETHEVKPGDHVNLHVWRMRHIRIVEKDG